jgi:hypothetical protein
MLIDLFGFNRQPYLIPDTGITNGDDGTVDDDMDEIDPDELKALLEDDDTEDDDKPEEGEESVEEKKTEEPSEPDSKLFSQEDIDRIIGERLARERRIQEERTMQEAEAKRQQQEKDRWWETRQQAQVKRWTDLGYEEEVATELAKEDVAKEYRLWQAEERLKQYEAQQQQGSKATQYRTDRNEYIAKNPLAAKYVQEIDDFAQNGAVLDFQTAMKFVLGDKLIAGDLLDSIKTTTEQKTLANVNKRSKMSVEKGGSAASTGAGSLTKSELIMAKRLGIAPKDYAKNK